MSFIYDLSPHTLRASILGSMYMPEKFIKYVLVSWFKEGFSSKAHITGMGIKMAYGYFKRRDFSRSTHHFYVDGQAGIKEMKCLFQCMHFPWGVALPVILFVHAVCLLCTGGD